MYLLRPKKWLSGKAVAKTLNYRSFRYPNSSELPTFVWERDFIPYIPSDCHIEARTEASGMSVVSTYQKLNKARQRASMREFGVKTPENYEAHDNKYVVRPVRHSQGRGWRVTTDPADYQQGEYISPLFNKTREYRVVFVKGEYCFTLKKIVEESATSDQPWNHANGSTFSTIRRSTPAILNTSFLDDVRNMPVVQHAHLIAFDVMLDDMSRYAVAETNFLPGLTIQENINAIAEAHRR